MELHNFGLHNAGRAVHLIEPDAAALTAFGPNLMTLPIVHGVHERVFARDWPWRRSFVPD